jgi:hypothetical protein
MRVGTLRWNLYRTTNATTFCAGLRNLQGRRELEGLVAKVKATRDAMDWGGPDRCV